MSGRAPFTRVRVANPGSSGWVRVENSRPVRFVVVERVSDSPSVVDGFEGMLLSWDVASPDADRAGAILIDQWRAWPTFVDGPFEVFFPSATSPSVELLLAHEGDCAPIPRNTEARWSTLNRPRFEQMRSSNRNFNVLAAATATVVDIKSELSGWGPDTNFERAVEPGILDFWASCNSATKADAVAEFWADGPAGTSRLIRTEDLETMGATGRSAVWWSGIEIPPLACSIRLRNTTGGTLQFDFMSWGRFKP